MKKLLAVLMVLAFVAPAMADDTLDVSGEMRVELYDISGSGFTAGSAGEATFWDQRFRLQLKIKPADGVMAVLRGDFAEGEWGFDNMPIGEDDRPVEGTHEVLMIDKAYLSAKRGMVTVTAGLNGYSLGDSFGYNNQGTGVDIKIDPKPVTVRLGYMMVDENGSLNDDDANDDVTQMYLDVGFKNEMLAINAYYAVQSDDATGSSDEPTMLGVMAKTKIAMVNVKAFLEMFGGDNGAGVDYMGTQFYADVNSKLSKTLTVGAEIVYSDGEDASGTEEKITRMPNAYAIYRTYVDRGPAKGSVIMNPYGSASDMFNLTGDAGSIGIRPYVDFKVIPELTLSANLGYFEEDEDKSSQESVLTYGVSALWAMAPKTTLGVGYMAWTPDEDTGVNLEDYEALYAIMKVKF